MIEKNLLISLLKLTKDGPVLIKNIKKDARIPLDIAKNLLKDLHNEGVLYLKDDLVQIESSNRLKLAVKAISWGADIEYASTFLRWQEFEDIVAVALERNGYVTRNNVRFRQFRRRWEIDIVGFKKPLVICVDCKQWQRRMHISNLRKIVEAQVERTRALANTLPDPELKFDFVRWKMAKFVPVILSLIPCSFKLFDTVPIVPVLQLQDFFVQLPAYLEAIKHFTKTFRHL